MPSEIDSPIIRYEYEVICRIIPERSKVLDLGCGEGDLLKLLHERRHALGTGVEVSEDKVYHCIHKGLSVHHGDIDEGLADYPDQSFDYVILSETLQEVHKPSLVIKEMLRVGKKGIVTFPNFGHWNCRLQVLLHGRTPITRMLPYRWFETPNVQFLSINDFYMFCNEMNFHIERSEFFSQGREIRLFPNLLAEAALFVLN